MHPYITHLLEDIENAKRPGYVENQPLYSHYETEENDEAASEIKDDEVDGDNIFPSFLSFEKDEDDEDIDDDLAEHLAEVERYVSEDPPSNFGDFCGLRVSDFPPAEQLTEDDMQMIIKAFEKMSFSWNIRFSFPETLPTDLNYKIMVNTLSEKTMITKHGFVTFDYCSGSLDGCEFGEYCNCLQYWQEDDSEKS